jgi:hypothetical protein
MENVWSREVDFKQESFAGFIGIFLAVDLKDQF